MCKKIIIFLFAVLSFFAVTLFCVSAECQHDFSPKDFSYNVTPNGDMTHSYFCGKNCGAYGTVSGGEKGTEPCNFVLFYEDKPTCTATGKRLFACSICFSNKEEIISVAEHSYITVHTFPTCTGKGYDTHTCRECDYSFQDNYKEPLEHISDGGIVEVLPTYESDGICKMSCRICGTLLESKRLDRFFREDTVTPYSGKIRNLKAVSRTASSVKLTWDKTEGADLYKIALSTDKKKHKVFTSDKPYITVKGLKSAQIYYLKVTPCSKGEEGEDSDYISVCTKPSKPTFTRAESAKKATATFKWKKINGVSGYELSYTAESFDKKKTVKTVTVSKGTSKTVKKLKSGKKYSFRVRAYKKFGKDKVYGAYSKIKRIRIR